jgi:iron complex outermembrane receptor protein
MTFSSRKTLLACGGALLALSMATGAIAQQRIFNVPSEDAAKAIPEFARQAGLQIIAPADRLKGVRTPAITGQLEARAALRLLLAGTGLRVAADDGAVITLRAPGEAAGPQGAGGAADNDSAQSLSEVVVTAKTGSQAVRTISGSVSAVTGAQLEAIGAQTFEDYLTRTPGVVFNSGIPGLSSATIRGVSTTTSITNNQGTTGYFINDVPLTDPFNSAGIPDIDAFDVADVTVLRGPQGTEFGSASLGGAINYQAAPPNLSDYQLHAQATVEDTDQGGVGGGGKIMLNLPLIKDVLAIRGVYVRRTDAGYIDNIGDGKQNANQTIVDGGRLEIAWQPTSSTRVSYLFLDQSESTADIGYAEPQFAGTLKKNTLIPEFADFRTTINNLRIDQDLGFTTLTATATYHQKTSDTNADYTSLFAPLLPGISPVAAGQTLDSNGTTFEVRLASHPGTRLDYLVGLYHDDTREFLDEPIAAANAVSVIDANFGAGLGEATAPGGLIFDGHGPFRGQETALFGEATWHFDDSWKATLGGRAFNMQTNNISNESGFYELASAGVLTSTLDGKQNENGFAPKGSITWTPSKDFLAYALVSKGFRFGGPNVSPSSATFEIPRGFDTDSVVNYELGERSSWFEGRLQLDATLFYIDWSRIQLQVSSPNGFNYVANAGKAKNYGVEATAAYRIAPGLTLQTNVTYLEAQLSSDFNPGSGLPIIPSGTTLPGASKWQVASTLSYAWRDGPLTPVFAVSQRYISTAPGDFSGEAPQGGYNLVDARATLHFDRFDLAAFVDNIGNSRGASSAAFPGGFPLQQYIVRPLTGGVTLDFKM